MSKRMGKPNDTDPAPEHLDQSAHWPSADKACCSTLEAAYRKDVQGLRTALKTHQTLLKRKTEELRQLQAALAASEARYRNLYDYAPRGYVTLDEQGAIQECNLAACRLLGSTQTALRKQPLSDFLVPEDRDRYRGQFVELFAAATPMHCELRLVRAIGEPLWVLLEATVHRRDQDQATLCQMAISDIAEHKRTEKALRASETHFRLFYQQAPVPYQSLDDNGNVLHVNAAWLQLLGYEHDDVIGHPISGFLSPEGQARLPEQFARFKATGQLHCTEVEFLHKDGSPISVEAEGRICTDDHGNFVRTHCVLYDLTERKRAERTLQEAELRYRTVAEFTHDWETWEGADGAMRYVSPSCERISGYSAEDFYADPSLFSTLIAEDDRDRWVKHRLVATADAGPQLIPLRIRRKDGDWIWLEHACQTVTDGAGMFLGYRASNRDITARRRAEETLQKGQRVLSTAERLARVGAWSYDVKADRFEPSEEWQAIHGLQSACLSMDELLSLAHPDDLPTIIVEFEQAVQQGRPYELQHRIVRRDNGEIRHVRAYAEVITGRYGNVLEILGACQDVTDAIAAGQALRQSEQRYRTIVDTAQEGIWMIDSRGQTSFANTRMAEMLGCTPDELAGQTLFDFMDDEWLAVAEQKLARRRAGVSEQHEFKFRRKDGSNLWAHLSTNPLFGADGSFAGALAMITDFTERKQVDEAQTFLLSCGLPATGQDFFESLARYLADTLALEYVCIDRLEGDGLHAQTVAIYNDGKFESNVTYDLKDTPCGAVVDEGVCCFPRDVRRLFPHDAVLQDLRAESYLGITLLDSKGRPIGLIAIIGRKPLTEVVRAEALLRLVATRAAGELERREAERSLRESEQRFRAFTEVTLVGMWKTDTSGDNTYVSERWSEMTGISPEQAQGAGWASGLHPADKEEVLKGWTRAALEDKPYVSEFRFVRPDGHVVWVLCQAVGLKDGAGRVVEWLGTISDITERKQIEVELAQYRHHLEELVDLRTAELSAAEAKASQILQSSADGIYGVDTEGRATFINPAGCEMLGYTAEQVFGRSVHALFHHSRPDGTPYPDVECPCHSVGSIGQSVRVDGECYWHADGHPIPVMYANHPLLHDGKITGAVISFVDLSARHAAEQAREQALVAADNLARARREFLANMSHEIRTPLNGVLGFAEIGYRNHQDSHKARDAFAKILQSGRLLLGVINDILDFSKIEQGQLRIEAVPVDVIEVLRETTELLRDRARDKGIALQVRKAADLPAVCLSDPLRLKQILTNLLSNAVKFTEKGNVTLAAYRCSDQLVWTVADTGIGMTEEQLNRLFTPFEQADGSTTRKFGGTGLGLAITKRLVCLLGGSIRVESSIGCGSLFEVRVPYRAVEAVPAPSVADPIQTYATSDCALQGLSILVAEDNEINQFVLEENLRGEGARVVVVGNGLEAVKRVLQDGPDAYDIVLMDIQMPELDGYEATRRILAFAPELPIAGQTAHACDEERDKCFAAGMVDHIAKPIDPTKLVALIRQHVKPGRIAIEKAITALCDNDQDRG